MSWTVKYRTEFTDILGLDWKIDIEEDGYAGSINIMQATGNPLNIDFLSNSDSLHESPIKGSTADIEVYSDTDFQWADIYAVYDLQFRVSIYFDDVHLYWQGYITPGQYREPYDGVAYPVVISASDSLGFLKNIDYKNAGIAYTGRRFVSQIILDVLSKIRVISFSEFVNIYETSMLSTVDDSPMDQEKLDVDVFLGMNCYEVLEYILIKYNALVRQVGGEYVIYRPIELIGPNIYGRKFTAATIKTSLVSTVPALEETGSTDGGIMNILQQAAKVTITQDYGYKDSWVRNWDIKGNTFSGDLLGGFTLQGWTQSVEHLAVPLTAIGESDGVFLAIQNNYPYLPFYITQTFGINAIASTDVFIIEFDYMVYNFSDTARTGEQFYTRVKSEATGHYLYGLNDDVRCAWDNSLNTIILTLNAPKGSSGWTTFKRAVAGIPDSGEYTITFYALNNAYPQINIAIKNVKFYTTSDALVMKWNHNYKSPILVRHSKSNERGRTYVEVMDNKEIVSRTYTCDNGVNGINLSYTHILGDVVDTEIDNAIEQFKGSIAIERTGH